MLIILPRKFGNSYLTQAIGRAERLAPIMPATSCRHGLPPRQLFTWRPQAQSAFDTPAQHLFVGAVVAPDNIAQVFLKEKRPGRTIYDWRHYLAVIQRKPGALRNGAPFTTMPDAFQRLQGHLLKRPGGDREMVEILSLVLQQDEQAVLCAVELAIDAGAPTKTHILNVLHRLVDGKAPTGPIVDAPQALSLQHEPKADVERYDALRGKAVRHAS